MKKVGKGVIKPFQKKKLMGQTFLVHTFNGGYWTGRGHNPPPVPAVRVRPARSGRHRPCRKSYHLGRSQSCLQLISIFLNIHFLCINIYIYIYDMCVYTFIYLLNLIDLFIHIIHSKYSKIKHSCC